jgi:hypothetical protein
MVRFALSAQREACALLDTRRNPAAAPHTLAHTRTHTHAHTHTHTHTLRRTLFGVLALREQLSKQLVALTQQELPKMKAAQEARLSEVCARRVALGQACLQGWGTHSALVLP